MDLRVLRFAEAIGRLGSFTRAAEEISIAQPALSNAIAKLESELGVQLFFRMPRGAVPTPGGKLLLARAARIFEEVDSLRRELSDVSDLRAGHVTVGFPPMYGLHYFPELAMAFRKRYPGIELTAIEGSASGIREQLEAGTIDIGVLEARRVDSAWKTIRLGHDEMVLAVARDHPLASRKRVTPSALSNLPMVVLSEGFLQRELLDKYCAAHQVRYRKVMECNFVHMIVVAAQAGHGAATLMRSMVDRQPELVAIPFEPKEVFNFDMCWRRDRYFSNACRALTRFAAGAELPAPC
jgi:DNA-binding transcriptional LysR family regulator